MKILLLCITAFISTNLDDLFINMLFFSQHSSRREVQGIFIGKYAGMGVLVAISLLGAIGLQMVPAQWLRMLGLFPLALGVRESIRSLRGSEKENETPAIAKALWISVTFITVANGADNIGVYLPLFAGFHSRQLAAALMIFAAMTGLWCIISKHFTGWPALQKLLAAYKPVLTPLVYILLGIYILLF